MLLSTALLASSLSLQRLRQGKESLVEAVKEKILLCELFKGWSRLRFHHIVQTRVCNINDAGGYFPSYLRSSRPAHPAASTGNQKSEFMIEHLYAIKRYEVSLSDPKGPLLFVAAATTMRTQTSSSLLVKSKSLFRGLSSREDTCAQRGWSQLLS